MIGHTALVRGSRNLPDDLIARLRSACAVEAAAETPVQQRNAVATTGVLMFAAVEAGWKVTDTARVMDLGLSTASNRVRDARARRGDAPGGLLVEEPADVRAPLDELKRRYGTGNR